MCQTKTITILDPLQLQLNKTNKTVKESIKLDYAVFSNKFNTEPVHEILDETHVIQTDIYNCGVFVCFYAYQIVNGKNI